MHCSVLFSKYLLLATSKDTNDGLGYPGGAVSDAQTTKAADFN